MTRYWPAAAAAVATLAAVFAAERLRPQLMPGPAVASNPVLACPSEVTIPAVEQTALAEARFTVANAGGGELVLSGFRTEYVCEGLEREVDGQFFRFRDVRLTPGESAVLRYQRGTNGAVGAAVRSPAWFKSNDPAVPEAVVVVTIEQILGGVTASPASVVLGAVPVGAAQERAVELSDSATPPRRIERVAIGGTGRVSVELVPPDRAALPWPDGSRRVGRLVVRVAADGPGPIDDTISLFVAGRATPDTVRVTGRVEAPVDVSPPELHLPRASSAGPLYAADVLVRCPADAVVECPAPPAGVGVTVHPAAGPVRRVTVSVDPKHAGREFGVSLAVRVGAVTHAAPVRVHVSPAEGLP